MKNLILTFCISTILILSCDQNDDISQELQLIGTWNWVESSGGIDGRTETPISTGNTMKIEFSSNSVKKIFKWNSRI